MATRTIYCVNCVKETAHLLGAKPQAREIIASCKCGRELKFSMTTAEDIEQQIAAHKDQNKDQRPLTIAEIKAMEALEQKANEILDEISD